MARDEELTNFKEAFIATAKFFALLVRGIIQFPVGAKVNKVPWTPDLCGIGLRRAESVFLNRTIIGTWQGWKQPTPGTRYQGARIDPYD